MFVGGKPMVFEFVSKSEYTPVRLVLEEIILNIQEEIKPFCTFQFMLIGSGRKKMITREVGSNKGFDFDYNLSLQKIKGDDDSPQQIRSTFLNIINKVAKRYGYRVEDNKSAITIKLINQDNKKIIHSCDFGIVEDYTDDNDNERQQIIIRDKTSIVPRYFWNERPKSSNYAFKLSNIEASGLWEVLKFEYLRLKNNNKDSDKKSYQLFIEAVSNVYNKYEWQK